VDLLPPDIDTALRIDKQKGRRHAGLFCSDDRVGRASRALPPEFSVRQKNFSRCTQLFVMMRYY
jgi:hypothetical protein